jgi:type IV pilus assembly protein PilB
MIPGRPNLGRILLDNGLINQAQLDAALDHQAAAGCRLGEALVQLGICSDTEIARSLAEQLESPFVDLHLIPPDPAVLPLIPRELALEHAMIPVHMDGDRLLIAVRDPFDIQVDHAIRQATDLPVTLAIAPETQLRELLQRYYSVSSGVVHHETHERAEVELEHEHQIPVEKLIAAGEQMSTIQVVNSLIADAVRRRASDLHLKPDQNGIQVRYRVDGRMCSIATLQKSYLQSVVARSKIMCGMDISETRKPQDGNCRVRVGGKSIELRASTLPGVFGEIVVFRILSHDSGVQRLEDLGFDTSTLRDLRRLLAMKNGMLVVTGPTGSGKTTTLYAALHYLNRPDVNILTVEDPVEIKVPGISQVQVDERAGRTFASTLRSMLRQDPDVIMVGEIRDGETADIACRAALTGHLVLTTLHTRHAFGTVARLVDLGVPPYMLGAALNGVEAQRLARRVCEFCAVEYEPHPGLLHALRDYYGPFEDARFRKGKGCPHCHYTGIRGRVGIYELLVIDEDYRRLLTDGVAPDEVKKFADERGFRTMERDAFDKACKGIIPPEEIIQLGLGMAVALDELGVDPAEVAPPPPAPSKPEVGNGRGAAVRTNGASVGR